MTQPIALFDPREIEDAGVMFHRVFKSENTLDQPFCSSRTRRLILFPNQNLYQIPVQHYEAIARAAGQLGEATAYFSLTDSSAGSRPGAEYSWQERAHFRIRLDSYPYEALRATGEWSGLMEYSLYSSSGSWGALVSHELHWLLGGSDLFMDAFLGVCPMAVTEVHDFCAYWRDNWGAAGYKPTWEIGLLQHIYGAKADTYVQEISGQKQIS
ncbi:MAG: hypothetical protein ACYCW6_15505 [Candidatus Xenobia bacterium]